MVWLSPRRILSSRGGGSGVHVGWGGTSQAGKSPALAQPETLHRKEIIFSSFLF